MGAMSRSNQPLSAPEKLGADHDLSGFECGEPSLDDWLRRRALQNEEGALRAPMWSALDNRWLAIMPLLWVL